MSQGEIPRQSALARSRENQRRSRMRRMEYLQSLQAAAQRFEARGIEASPEVQESATNAAAQNQQLRTIMERHSVAQEMIQRFMDARSLTRPQEGDELILGLMEFVAHAMAEAASPPQQAAPTGNSPN